jgi:hypothetical protein
VEALLFDGSLCKVGFFDSESFSAPLGLDARHLRATALCTSLTSLAQARSNHAVVTFMYTMAPQIPVWDSKRGIKLVGASLRGDIKPLRMPSSATSTRSAYSLASSGKHQASATDAFAHRKRGETQCVFSPFETPHGMILIPSENHALKVRLYRPMRKDRWF